MKIIFRIGILPEYQGKFVKKSFNSLSQVAKRQKVLYNIIANGEVENKCSRSKPKLKNYPRFIR
jgi:hypothetical protein